MSEEVTHQLGLKKSLGYIALTVYGVGNMLGAGIYGTIGKAAHEMGNAIWMAFAASMVAAGLTGLSYASIGSRYPKAGGAAFITQRAFALPMLAYVVGLVVMASGLTSMATTTNVFAGYFFQAINVDPTGWMVWLVIISLVAVLAFINFWGLREAVWLNAVCTAIEVGGLLLVICVGLRYWGSVNYLDATAVGNPSGNISASLILTGSVLTFYSFIGFEDLLNVSEEVKNPRKTFPMALVSALIIASLIYMAVCITAVSVVPSGKLAELTAVKNGPLTEVIKVAAPWFNHRLFSIMALFAVTNTALLNYIMGSRLAYGMSRQGLLPSFLGKLHATRRTPYMAIIVLALIVILMVMAGDLGKLARATSILLLLSFSVVNAALIVLKYRKGEPKGGFEVPVVVPAGGILISLAMIGSSLMGVSKDINQAMVARDLAAAGSVESQVSDASIYMSQGAHVFLVFVIIAVICAMYVILKPKGVLMDEHAMELEMEKDEEKISK